MKRVVYMSLALLIGLIAILLLILVIKRYEVVPNQSSDTGTTEVVDLPTVSDDATIFTEESVPEYAEYEKHLEEDLGLTITQSEMQGSDGDYTFYLDLSDTNYRAELVRTVMREDLIVWCGVVYDMENEQVDVYEFK